MLKLDSNELNLMENESEIRMKLDDFVGSFEKKAELLISLEIGKNICWTFDQKLAIIDNLIS